MGDNRGDNPINQTFYFILDFMSHTMSLKYLFWQLESPHERREIVYHIKLLTVIRLIIIGESWRRIGPVGESCWRWLKPKMIAVSSATQARSRDRLFEPSYN